MSNVPTISISSDPIDHDTPLPLIVAKRWDFPLAYTATDSEELYAVLDWIGGLTGANPTQASNSFSQVKRKTLISNKSLPYVASDGKTYQRDYTDDKGLYLIAQHLRVTKARPVLDAIKRFLAESGAFVDLVRREPETVITSGAIDPDDALDAAIAAYRAQGKDDKWIEARVSGKIKRARFTAALQTAIGDVITRWHYALATDEVYLGLWQRTAAVLKDQLDLSSKVSLRDHQPTLALAYQGLAEEIAAQRLGDSTDLTWEQARVIVRMVADLVGEQASMTSRFLRIDLATGVPLFGDVRDSSYPHP